jgi:hypothetical protein
VDLFNAFSRASLQKSDSAVQISINDYEDKSSVRSNKDRHSNDLLNVTAEISALRECKDLKEELIMLENIFDAQKSVAHANRMFAEADGARYPGKHYEDTPLLSQFRHQPVQSLQNSNKVIARIAKQATISHENLIQLLDLKQKQASVMEAAYARSQAEETARQGKTIMVFTITTVVFLPISFLAAFFAINIEEFSSSANAGRGLRLSFVLKYMLGLGLATSLLLILVAFNVAKIKGITRKARAPKELQSQLIQSTGSDVWMERMSQSGDRPEKVKHALSFGGRLGHRFSGGVITQPPSKELNQLVRETSRDIESGQYDQF